MKLEKTKNIAEVLMWIGLVPQWIFMTSRGVPGGLLIAIFIMPIFMILAFLSFMMHILIAVEEKSFKNTDELIEYLKQNRIKNKNILLKGSRGIALEKVIEFLKK